jgi:hypothetical protein
MVVKSSTLYARRRASWTRGPAAAVVATATAAALLGLLLSVRVLFPASHHHAVTHQIGDDIPTSFGIVAVEFVRGVDGVSHRALAGANHGVSGYVEAGKVQIQVAVAITNRSRRALEYTVHDFKLRATIKGKTSTLPATAGDLPDGRILPDAGIEGHLDFTLPAGNAVASLIFHDSGARAPVRIDLGTIAGTAQAPTHSHQ